MKTSDRIRPIDIPQADSLSLVRAVVRAVHVGHHSIRDIATATSFSERHVRYRLAAARILRLLTDDYELTRTGCDLLLAEAGSAPEKSLLAKAIARTPAIAAVAPQLLTHPSPDLISVARLISRYTGLSKATAERRAKCLRSWARQVRRDSDR